MSAVLALAVVPVLVVGGDVTRAVVPLVAPCAAARGQQSVTATADAPAGPSADVPPADLTRIRRALERPSTLSASVERYRDTFEAPPDRPVFRVEVEGEWPSFSTFLAEGESLTGPAPWGAMTHAEFLNLVTPPQARLWGASTNGDLLQLALTSLAANLFLPGAASGGTGLVDAVRQAIRSSRERAAREEVQAVLAEIERRRREAGSEKETGGAPAPQDGGTVAPPAPSQPPAPPR